MRTEVARLDVRDERSGGGREQHLPTVAGRRDPRRADHVEARVPLLAEVRNPRVEAHAYLDDRAVGPAVVADPLLPGERGAERGLDLLKDRRDLVARRVDLGAAVRSDLLA